MDHSQQVATPETLREIKRGRAVGLAGKNFSGRTRLLRCWTGFDAWDGGQEEAEPGKKELSAYIGPEVYNSISGLATTVRQELLLHSPDVLDGNPVSGLVENLRLSSLYERNPFTLSGGEQTCLAVASGLALGPRALAIDCPTEQLDFEVKVRLLEWLSNGAGAGTATVIADNRLAEYEDEFEQVVRMREELSCESPERHLHFEPLAPEGNTCGMHFAPCGMRLDALEFGYAKGPGVLRGVSASLEPGLYLLDGKNGAGKTTLAKVLSGVLRPAEGRILVGGCEARPWREPGRVVGYHFQNPDLQLFSTTVEEEVVAGPRALGLRGEELLRRAEAALGAFGLSRIRGQHPLDLPFVIRKRVALAATLAMGRPWTILDEPTLGQDDATSEAITRIIANVLSCGAGVIVITHSQWFRRRLPAKVLRLESGVIAG
jgi:energy-coupling factor transport system ATP-binding protein